LRSSLLHLALRFFAPHEKGLGTSKKKPVFMLAAMFKAKLMQLAKLGCACISTFIYAPSLIIDA
jgi:hypothetical protein